jgi:hypothetical protein
MENFIIKINSVSEIFNKNHFTILKHKRKRERFIDRIDSLMDLPEEIISKFTNYSFMYDDSIPICLEKLKNENKIPYLSMNESNDKINSNYEEVIDEKKITLKEEIDEIVNELEIFARHNRKCRMIEIMGKIADFINEDLFEIDELIDYFIFGNKQSNIENEYLDKQKRKYSNNIKLCDYTNKLLMNDDDQYYNKLNDSKDTTKL